MQEVVWSIQIPQVNLTAGKTREYNLVMYSGRKISNFFKQLTSFFQEFRRVDEMGEKQRSSYSRIQENQNHTKAERKEEKMKPEVFEITGL